MTIITITDHLSGSTAKIAPELGFNCFEFHAVVGDRVVDVLDAVPGFETGGQRASGSGIRFFSHFRIASARASFHGMVVSTFCPEPTNGEMRFTDSVWTAPGESFGDPMISSRDSFN